MIRELARLLSKAGAVGLAAGVLVAHPAAAVVSMTLAANPPTAAAGQRVTITATITSLDGGTPSGYVKFSLIGRVWSGPTCDSQPLVPVGSTFQATCTTSFGETGTNTVDAQYYGTDGFYATELNYQVSAVPTTLTLASDTDTPVAGNAFTLSATVSPGMPDSAPVYGTVQFLDNGVVIDSCRNSRPGGEVPVVLVNGRPPPVAFCEITYSQPGTHTLVARFHDDPAYADAQSAPLTLSVGRSGGRLTPCPGQDTPFSTAGLGAARSALVCLVNRVRGRYGLNALSELPSLDVLAQAHPLVGARPSGAVVGPGVVFDAFGDRTPYAVIASLMANHGGCMTLLNEQDRIGVGVVPRAVFARPPVMNEIESSASPVWTAELVATDTVNPFNVSAQDSCPHPLPPDAAGQRAAPRYRVSPHDPTTTPFELYPFGPQVVHGALRFGLSNLSARPLTATITFAVGAGRASVRRTVSVHGLRHGATAERVIRVGASALRRSAGRVLVVSITVAERAPRRTTYQYEIGS